MCKENYSPSACKYRKNALVSATSEIAGFANTRDEEFIYVFLISVFVELHQVGGRADIGAGQSAGEVAPDTSHLKADQVHVFGLGAALQVGDGGKNVLDAVGVVSLVEKA